MASQHDLARASDDESALNLQKFRLACHIRCRFSSSVVNRAWDDEAALIPSLQKFRLACRFRCRFSSSVVNRAWDDEAALIPSLQEFRLACRFRCRFSSTVPLTSG